MIKGASMFSSAGIAETYFSKAGIKIIVANELIPKRASFYKDMYKDAIMVSGDICDERVMNEFLNKITKDVKFLIATPPCQGFSTLGTNKIQKQMQLDERNYLIFKVFEVIDAKNFDYILIENVPRFLDLYFPYENRILKLEEILSMRYSKKYNIDISILNAKDYGVPQLRPRAIIKMYKKRLLWNWPQKQKEISLKEAIGHLPSLESGEDSGIKYHKAKKHNDRDILAMKHTPEGCSALNNEIYFPKKANGERIKGFHNTYKRMKWDSPAPARTTNNGNIGSHNNVHPGRKLKDGTYSDARVLTLRELFIVSSLPEEWSPPNQYSENFIREIIGEAIPPMLAYKIVKGIENEH